MGWIREWGTDPQPTFKNFLVLWVFMAVLTLINLLLTRGQMDWSTKWIAIFLYTAAVVITGCRDGVRRLRGSSQMRV